MDWQVNTVSTVRSGFPRGDNKLSVTLANFQNEDRSCRYRYSTVLYWISAGKDPRIAHDKYHIYTVSVWY
jgi:hypothetical protein